MAHTSKRNSSGRVFDCVYDPNYIVPTEQEAQRAQRLATKRAATVHLVPKYNAMFENVPREARCVFRQQVSCGSFGSGPVIPVACRRLTAGANNPNERKVTKISTSPAECKIKPCNLDYPKPSNPNVSIVNVHLSDSQTHSNFYNSHEECKNVYGPTKAKRSKTRGTQSIYRESSAQTLPYLPDVANAPEVLETLEVFRLPTILPGDGPPGLYEVEVLERARKRWAFNKALKETFKRQVQEAREQTTLSENKAIYEAFEWEYWIEREEYIMECQMMRLEIVIRMFDQREQEMHEASLSRLEQCCAKIVKKRDAGLRKNEIEYGRALRRLEMKRLKIPRNWRKETISNELGNPSSEFYAPQMRYGVNPTRRHFNANRKAFEAHIDGIEKKVSHMGKLECPYAKLRKWSNPKARLHEVEVNFCSEGNLNKLYKGLKSLREQSIKRKFMPKCLIEKVQKPSIVRVPTVKTQEEETPEHIIIEYDYSSSEDDSAADKRRQMDENQRLRNMVEIAEEARKAKLYLKDLSYEMYDEEMEAMLLTYEGTTIGWLLRFLSDEMCRLQELRKMHFITIMAQKERWRREAKEAGLRQKENDMRTIYEKMYEETFVATEVTQDYLQNVLSVDTRAYADEVATENITALAKRIDNDIMRWLLSFQSIQNPNTFEPLRYMLKDIIFPNLENILNFKEKEETADYIINCVILAKVYRKLEPYDISSALADEVVDRLIDNDLYYISDECSDCEECLDGTCKRSQCEAKAIMRKLIRYAVPGRRWMTETERVADTCVSDILEEVFEEERKRGSIRVGSMDNQSLKKQFSYFNLLTQEIASEQKPLQDFKSESSTSSAQQPVKTETFDNLIVKSKNITAILKHRENMHLLDPDQLPPDKNLIKLEDLQSIEDFMVGLRQVPILKRIPSSFDIILKADHFEILPDHVPSESNSESSRLDLIEDDKDTKKLLRETHEFVRQLINSVIHSFLPPEERLSHITIYSTDFEKIPQKHEMDDGIENCLDDIISKIVDSADESTFSVQEAEKEEEEEVILKDELGSVKSSIHSIEDYLLPENWKWELSEDEVFEIEIEQRELDALRRQDCKCQAEIQRLNYIEEMLKEGKVRMLSQFEQPASIHTFVRHDPDPKTQTPIYLSPTPSRETLEPIEVVRPSTNRLRRVSDVKQKEKEHLERHRFTNELIRPAEGPERSSSIFHINLHKTPLIQLLSTSNTSTRIGLTSSMDISRAPSAAASSTVISTDNSVKEIKPEPSHKVPPSGGSISEHRQRLTSGVSSNVRFQPTYT